MRPNTVMRESEIINVELDAIRGDLLVLIATERDLIYNIKLLKQKNITVIISEYKKSVEQLKKIKELITELKNEEVNLEFKLKTKINNDNYNTMYDKSESQCKILKFKRK